MNRSARSRFLLLAAAAAAIFALALLGGCSRKLAGRGAPPYARQHRDQYTLTHRVAEGETLARIADNYYGDPGRAADIAAWNGIHDPDLVAVGSALLLRFSAEQWDRAERRLAAMDPYNLGVDALRAGRLDEAREAFDRALAIEPDFPDARYNLALVYMKRGRNAEAADLLSGLLAADPEDRDYLFAHGNVLFHQADFTGAADRFGMILAADPADREAAFGRARALTEAGPFAAAEAAWLAYLELDRTSAWADEAREQLRALREGAAPAP